MRSLCERRVSSLIRARSSDSCLEPETSSSQRAWRLPRPVVWREKLGKSGLAGLLGARLLGIRVGSEGGAGKGEGSHEHVGSCYRGFAGTIERPWCFWNLTIAKR